MNNISSPYGRQSIVDTKPFVLPFCQFFLVFFYGIVYEVNIYVCFSDVLITFDAKFFSSPVSSILYNSRTRPILIALLFIFLAYIGMSYPSCPWFYSRTPRTCDLLTCITGFVKYNYNNTFFLGRMLVSNNFNKIDTSLLNKHYLLMCS